MVELKRMFPSFALLLMATVSVSVAAPVKVALPFSAVTSPPNSLVPSTVTPKAEPNVLSKSTFPSTVMAPVSVDTAVAAIRSPSMSIVPAVNVPVSTVRSAIVPPMVPDTSVTPSSVRLNAPLMPPVTLMLAASSSVFTPTSMLPV